MTLSLRVHLRHFVKAGLCLAGLLCSLNVLAQSDDYIFANGFEFPATLILNEVNAALSSNQDLVELRATTGGSTLGIALIQDPSADGLGAVTLAILPEASVATGDLIVVHLNPSVSVTRETSSKTSCIDSTCYSGAWDELGGTTGIAFSNRVLAVRGADGIYSDAVPFSRSTSSTVSFPAAVQYIQSLGLWLPADCNGSPCDYTTTPTVAGISVDWTTIGTNVTGASASRHAVADSNTAGDWTIAATSTFGATNP